MKPIATTRKPQPRVKEQIYVVPFHYASGRPGWRVSGSMGNDRRVRENFSTEAEAMTRKDELLMEIDNVQSSSVRRLTTLTDAQLRDAETAYKKIGDRSLLEMVQFSLDKFRAPVTEITVEKAFEQFMAEKRKSNLRPRSVSDLSARVGILKQLHADKLVSEIQVADLRAIVEKSNRTIISNNNMRRTMFTFFTWAKEQEFCTVNPMLKIKAIKFEKPEPKILTLAETRDLIDKAANFKDGILLPYIVLGLFAGLRPTELAGISWDNIDLQDGTVTITADIAKMRSRRVVAFPCLPGKTANLISWLAPHALEKTPIVGTNWRKDFDAMKAEAGWSTNDQQPDRKAWTQDIVRHTAISNHFAYFEHEGQTAKWAGNSPNVIHSAYNGLVKKTQAAEFWSIVPDKSKVIQLKPSSKIISTEGDRLRA